MSCYFRHMKDVFESIGIDINAENKKDIDKAIHKIVGTEYKDCSLTWKKVKEIIKGDDADKKNEFIFNMKKELNI
jgi:hypothetical protein